MSNYSNLDKCNYPAESSKGKRKYEEILSPEVKVKDESKKRKEVEEDKMEEDDEEEDGNKYHMVYIEPRAYIEPSEESIKNAQKCTNCHAPLVGNEFKYPLSAPCYKNKLLLKAPYCLGCKRLLGAKNMTQQYKTDLNKWFIKGKHPDLRNNNISKINFHNAAQRLKKRGQEALVKLPLYEHPSWGDWLKSVQEIDFEFKMAHPEANQDEIRKMSENYLNSLKGIIKRPIPDINTFETVTGEELRNLTMKANGKDVFVNLSCSSNRLSPIGITYDHKIPLSRARFEKHTHSSQNFQIVSRCLNEVKGNYSDEELMRWLEQLLKTYRNKYPL